jgi:hypothetical protein
LIKRDVEDWHKERRFAESNKNQARARKMEMILGTEIIKPLGREEIPQISSSSSKQRQQNKLLMNPL